MVNTTYHRTTPRAIHKRTGLERRPTQEQQIMNLLTECHPNWVPLPRILALGISQYSARIWTLRHKHGYNIENRLVELSDGRKGGEFRLLSLLPDPRIAESPALIPASPTPRAGEIQRAAAAADPGLFANDPAWIAAEAMRREIRERQYD